MLGFQAELLCIPGPLLADLWVVLQISKTLGQHMQVNSTDNLAAKTVLPALGMFRLGALWWVLVLSLIHI